MQERKKDAAEQHIKQLKQQMEAKSKRAESNRTQQMRARQEKAKDRELDV